MGTHAHLRLALVPCALAAIVSAGLACRARLPDEEAVTKPSFTGSAAPGVEVPATPEPPRALPSESGVTFGALQVRVRGPGGSAAAGAANFTSSDFFVYERAFGDGRFAIDTLTPGEGWLVLRVPGCARLESHVAIEAGRTAEVALDLEPGVVLAGRVVDGRGAPLAGARVDGLCCFEGADELRCSLDTLTDERGAFRLDELPGGDLSLRVSCADRRGFQQEFGRMGPGDASDALEIVLAEGNALGGLVRYPDGAPALGVTVWVEDEDDGEGYSCTSDGEGASPTDRSA